LGAAEFALGALLVAIGGGLGSVARGWLASWRGLLEWGTIAANSAAAGIVGLVLGAPNFAFESANFWLVGLAGGLSTFSGVVADAYEFFHRGRLIQSALTGVANLGIPLGVLWVSLNLV
jgi:fluoride ion exporter CrcB/FEX